MCQLSFGGKKCVQTSFDKNCVGCSRADGSCVRCANGYQLQARLCVLLGGGGGHGQAMQRRCGMLARHARWAEAPADEWSTCPPPPPPAHHRQVPANGLPPAEQERRLRGLQPRRQLQGLHVRRRGPVVAGRSCPSAKGPSAKGPSAPLRKHGLSPALPFPTDLSCSPLPNHTAGRLGCWYILKPRGISTAQPPTATRVQRAVLDVWRRAARPTRRPCPAARRPTHATGTLPPIRPRPVAVRMAGQRKKIGE